MCQHPEAPDTLRSCEVRVRAVKFIDAMCKVPRVLAETVIGSSWVKLLACPTPSSVAHVKYSAQIACIQSHFPNLRDRI